jgi:predicted O-methyltransferase YrrM
MRLVLQLCLSCQSFVHGAPQGGIDFLFLDGMPREYLAYLKAAEPRMAPNAVVVADNAGVFADGGLKPYLEYVRGSGKYESRFEASTLEWRDDVADGLEVSVFKG